MSEDGFVRLLLGAFSIVGALGGTALGAWLQRRSAQQQESRLWAVEFRKKLSTFKQLVLDFKSGVARADRDPHNKEALLDEAWDLFQQDWADVRSDAIAYLGLVPAIGQALRNKLLDRSSSLENAVVSMDTDRILDAIGKVVEVVDEITVAIDTKLGIKQAK